MAATRARALAAAIEKKFGSLDAFKEAFSKEAATVFGSGWAWLIVDPSGVIMTNNHVIENADQVRVALSDKREFEAEILLRDPRSDLAVLKIKDGREKFPAIAPARKAIKNKTDAICTCFSTFFTNTGNFIPTIIPIITGIPRMMKTVRNISTGSMVIGTRSGDLLA